MKTIFILRKPLEGNLVKNTLTHGCGGLNIDAARIPTTDNLETHSRGADAGKSKGIYGDSRAQETHQTEGQTLGRFPANFILTHLDACELRGTKKIKSGKNNSNLGGTVREVGLYKDGLKKRAKDQHQGEETIEDWVCVESCSVKGLDNQSGFLQGRGNTRPSISGGGMYGHGITFNNFGKSDEGGASRFFKTLQKDND